MKKVIVAAVLLVGCAAQKPMTRVERNKCTMDCAVVHASCVYGVKYCKERRTECEAACR